MNKFAVVFGAAALMALSACGEKPANESANAANAVVENVVDNAAATLENAADNATNEASEAVLENAADNVANAAH